MPQWRLLQHIRPKLGSPVQCYPPQHGQTGELCNLGNRTIVAFALRPIYNRSSPVLPIDECEDRKLTVFRACLLVFVSGLLEHIYCTRLLWDVVEFCAHPALPLIASLSTALRLLYCPLANLQTFSAAVMVFGVMVNG